MSNAFNNGTIQNINRIGVRRNILKIPLLKLPILQDIASEKFHNWPVTELIIMVTIGAVLVVITVSFNILKLIETSEFSS